jgi:putative transposase
VSRLVARDADVLSPLRTLAAQYPRDGYRTIRIFLERDGHALGTDRMYRLWRQEGLQVPKKRPRRRVAASRPRPLPPTAIDHVWAYDFVFDTCADGRTLKCLTVIDEFRRECLAIDVAGAIRSGRDDAVVPTNASRPHRVPASHPRHRVAEKSGGSHVGS